MYKSRKYRQGWGVLTTSYQRISQKPVRTSFEKQLDPVVQWLLEGRSVSVFLRKPIITCDFPGGRGSRPHAHPCYTSCCGPNLHTLCVHLSNLSSRWSSTGHVFNSHRQSGPFSCRISLCTVPLPFLSCSSYPVVSMHFQLEFENMWILIGWCLKPSDLDLQRFQKRIEQVSA